jgi:hypothetical protein
MSELSEHQEALSVANIIRREGIRPGRVFRHQHLLDPDWHPDVEAGEHYSDGPKALCRITAVRNGQIYFGVGADCKKAKLVTPVDRFLIRAFSGWVD